MEAEPKDGAEVEPYPRCCGADEELGLRRYSPAVPLCPRCAALPASLCRAGKAVAGCGGRAGEGAAEDREGDLRQERREGEGEGRLGKGGGEVSVGKR